MARAKRCISRSSTTAHSWALSNRWATRATPTSRVRCPCSKTAMPSRCRLRCVRCPHWPCSQPSPTAVATAITAGSRPIPSHTPATSVTSPPYKAASPSPLTVRQRPLPLTVRQRPLPLTVRQGFALTSPTRTKSWRPTPTPTAPCPAATRPPTTNTTTPWRPATSNGTTCA